MNKAILIVGDANMDVIVPYGKTLQMQRTGFTADHEGLSVTLTGGGTCGNTASGCGRLKTRIRFAGKDGDDLFGRQLKAGLEEDGVDCSAMVLDPSLSTSFVLAVIGENKDRCLYAVPPVKQAVHQLKEEDLPDSLLEDVFMVYTSCMILREEPAASSVVSFLEKAKRKGIPVALDLNTRVETDVNEGYLSNVSKAVNSADLVIGSLEAEYRRLFKKDPRIAMKELAARGKTVIGHEGAQDVIALKDHEEIRVPVFPTQIVDTIGAGDAFNAGLLSALWYGKGLREAVLWGNACASYSLTQNGARSCPDLDTLTAFLSI